MTLQNKYNYYFYTILSILSVILISFSNTLSISYKESLNYFVNNSVLSYIIRCSTFIFGENDIALRLPFIIFYVLSVWLVYKMSENYYKNEKDRLLSIVIFMILPGVLSSSLLVNSSVIVLFFTLLYIYLYKKNQKHPYILLFLCLFIDNSFAILFLALFFYSLKTKDKTLTYVSVLFCVVSIYIYGFSTGGKPKSYFLDTFAIYASVFSPFLFFYFLYTIYRIGFKGEKTLIWYISITALFFSLLMSFRQKIYIEDFAPFVVISSAYMLKNFYHSYRIRLKRFRFMHTVMFFIVMLMLVFNAMLTFFNKPIYLLLDRPSKHFVYNYHFIKEISQELKKRNINFISSDNEELLLRLRYYGLEKGNKYFLSNKKLDDYDDKIIIKYYDKNLYQLYIKKK